MIILSFKDKYEDLEKMELLAITLNVYKRSSQKGFPAGLFLWTQQ